MNTRVLLSLKKLRPTTVAEIRSALAKRRDYSTGVMAFKADMLPLREAPAADQSGTTVNPTNEIPSELPASNQARSRKRRT
jgi:hypothetical protein